LDWKYEKREEAGLIFRIVRLLKEVS
jgi:hypothetical protein